jgi:hypothetical protein
MNEKIRVKTNQDSRTAYLKLPGYPEEITPGLVAKSISLDDIYDYEGPRVQLDFNKEGKLIGVEVVA